MGVVLSTQGIMNSIARSRAALKNWYDVDLLFSSNDEYYAQRALMYEELQKLPLVDGSIFDEFQEHTFLLNASHDELYYDFFRGIAQQYDPRTITVVETAFKTSPVSILKASTDSTHGLDSLLALFAMMSAFDKSKEIIADLKDNILLGYCGIWYKRRDA